MHDDDDWLRRQRPKVPLTGLINATETSAGAESFMPVYLVMLMMVMGRSRRRRLGKRRL